MGARTWWLAADRATFARRAERRARARHDWQQQGIRAWLRDHDIQNYDCRQSTRLTSERARRGFDGEASYRGSSKCT